VRNVHRSLDQLLRAKGTETQLNFSGRTVVLPRLVGVDEDGHEVVSTEAAWVVHATKERPWRVRSRNRRHNKRARAARRINRR
jgi:hypothetical protein